MPALQTPTYEPVSLFTLVTFCSPISEVSRADKAALGGRLHCMIQIRNQRSEANKGELLPETRMPVHECWMEREGKRERK